MESIIAIGRPLAHLRAENASVHALPRSPHGEEGTSGETMMSGRISQRTPKAVAAEMDAQIRGLAVRKTPNVRAVRRRYSQELAAAAPAFVLSVCRLLLERYGLRSVAYELILNHKAAFQRVGVSELEELGRGINSWWSADSFARTLSGPAWREGYVGDDLFVRWARSHDRWWRRAALVSTVALNVRSKGGQGDVGRTLKVCSLLVADHDEMVVKAMSWALRELIVHDPKAVRGFEREHADQLAARVRREVRNKLATGRKNPISGVPRTRRSTASRQRPRTQLSRSKADRPSG